MRKRVMGWSTLSVLTLSVRCREKVLVVFVAPIAGSLEWTVTAVETRAEDAAAGADAVFAHHAHKNLGPCRGMLASVRAADKYAAAWQNANEASDECACKEIA